jgi:hypothetical protein
MNSAATLMPPPHTHAAGAAQVAEPQHTTFPNCLALSPVLRVRWAVHADEASIEIGLEGLLKSGTYLAFGPAAAGACCLPAPIPLKAAANADANPNANSKHNHAGVASREMLGSDVMAHANHELCRPLH